MWPARKSMLRARSTTVASDAAASVSASMLSTFIAGSGSAIGAGVAAVRSSSPPSTTNTSRWPIWRSQPAAMRARTPSSSSRARRALRTPIQESVACTNCPPGAETLPGR